MDSATFGARIRRAREAKGMSQEELAALVAKSQKAISQYEKGTRRMFVNDLPKFASALDVPLSFFFLAQNSLEELDALILAECQRLKTVQAKQAVLKLIRVIAELSQPLEN